MTNRPSIFICKSDKYEELNIYNNTIVDFQDSDTYCWACHEEGTEAYPLQFFSYYTYYHYPCLMNAMTFPFKDGRKNIDNIEQLCSMNNEDLLRSKTDGEEWISEVLKRVDKKEIKNLKTYEHRTIQNEIVKWGKNFGKYDKILCDLLRDSRLSCNSRN